MHKNLSFNVGQWTVLKKKRKMYKTSAKAEMVFILMSVRGHLDYKGYNID